MIISLDRLLSVPDQNSRNSAMEGLRGYAIFLVFLTHFFIYFSQFEWATNLDKLKPTGIDSLGLAIVYYLHMSHYGVDIFFLLSGFLIAKVVLKPGFSYRPFFASRFLRIYPIFLLCLCLYYVPEVRAGHFWPKYFLANALLLNGIWELNIGFIYPSSWALFYEMAFYIVFPFLFLNLRGAWGVKLGMIAGLVLLISVAFSESYIRFEMFLVGAVIAFSNQNTISRIRGLVPDVVALAIYVVAAASYCFMGFHFQLFLLFFAPVSMLVIVKALYGDGLIKRIFNLTPLRYLGRISYSFYMTHGMPLMLIPKGHKTVVWWLIAFAATFALTCALSIVLFLIFERPYFLWRHKGVKKDAPLP